MNCTHFQRKKNFSFLNARMILLASSFFWGASFIFTKGLFLSEPHITTSIIVTGRLLIASLFMIPFLALTHRLERIRKGDWGMFLILSFFEPFIYSILETSGVSLLPGSLASIIIATIPLFVPFGVALIYKERLRVVTVTGVVLSLAGIMVMMVGPNWSFHANPKGLMFLGAAVAIAVAYTLVLVRILNHYHPVTITAYQNLFGFLYFIPVILLRNLDALPLLSFSPKMIGMLAFLGLLCSTVAYVCFNYGMRALGATAASVYNNLIPVFSLILAVCIGQERLTITKVIGMAVVLVGLFLSQRTPQEKDILPSSAEEVPIQSTSDNAEP